MTDSNRSRWQCERSSVRGGEHFRLGCGSQPLTFAGFLDWLATDDDFADWYSRTLAGFDGEAFYWELPPLTTAALENPAEFVLIDAPGIARMPPEPEPFAAHFASAEDDIAVFPNLGGDALLVVPCPRAAADVYPHFATFLRRAPASQRRSLWRRTATAVLEWIGDTPIWLSTAGGGVAWLHLRIDSRPKYYSYRPYAETAA